MYVLSNVQRRPRGSKLTGTIILRSPLTRVSSFGQRFVVIASLYGATTNVMLFNRSLCLRRIAFACVRNVWRERSMSQWMTVAFLGTSSGGGPSESRNCSSLVLDIIGDGSLWSTHLSSCAKSTNGRLTNNLHLTVVDGAEGTLRQFSLQPQGGRSFQVAKVNKIFITHMHRESFCYEPS